MQGPWTCHTYAAPSLFPPAEFPEQQQLQHDAWKTLPVPCCWFVLAAAPHLPSPVPSLEGVVLLRLSREMSVWFSTGVPRDLSCLSWDFKVELTMALRSISASLLHHFAPPVGPCSRVSGGCHPHGEGGPHASPQYRVSTAKQRHKHPTWCARHFTVRCMWWQWWHQDLCSGPACKTQRRGEHMGWVSLSGVVKGSKRGGEPDRV